MNSIIECIRIYQVKGNTGIEKDEAHLIKNLGIDGDLHAIGGDRQISILAAETREKIAESKEKGLCFSRFKENFTIHGIDPRTLKPEVQLSAGDAIIEITGETKRCHKECSLYEAGKNCPLTGMSLFAKVIKSGIIRKNDQAVIIMK